MVAWRRWRPSGADLGFKEVVAEEPFFRSKIPPSHPDPCIIGGAEALAVATAVEGLTTMSQVSSLRFVSVSYELVTPGCEVPRTRSV